MDSGGYRLYRYEVFNWGTFDRFVWSIDLEGGSALLTGKNGSGKSTLVDGLTTLLVEKSSRRSYNQAAGDRRERSERSYVEGAYAQSLDTDETGRQRTLKLRSGDTCSVLLAMFHNTVRQQIVTLAQVFYITGGELHKFYVVAHVPLSIAADFPSSGRISQMKRSLRDREHVSVMDTARDYGAAVRRAFNLRTEQAMTLFNEIVAMKEIGDLNDFVRGHMLEPDDMDSAIASLHGNYTELNASYALIQRADRQQEMLQPLVSDASSYQRQLQRLRQLERQIEMLPYFMDDLAMRLITNEEAEQQQMYHRHEQEKAQMDVRMSDLRERERILYAALQNNEVMQQITALEREIGFNEERLRLCRHDEQTYLGLMRKLDRAYDGTLAAFMLNREHAASRRSQFAADIDAIQSERTRLEQQRLALDEQITAIREEITLLSERKSQIPKEELFIRQQMCHELGLDERDLPYIGELLRVDDREEEWRLAIEKLLNGFARQMIVPEAVYRRVRQYVNETNLRGMLIYHRVEDVPGYVSDHHMREDSVYYKLHIHPETPYHNWLRQKLLKQADYVCCERDSQIDHEERAITRTGQIKRGENRYEKDDRPGKIGRAGYVLGWDNADKIASLKEDGARLVAQRNRRISEIDRLAEDEKRLRDLENAINRLLEFDDFARIDTDRITHEIEAQRASLSVLRNQSDSVRRLEQEREAVQSQIDDLALRLNDVREAMSRCDGRLNDLTAQFEDCQRRLQGIDIEAERLLFDRIESDLSEAPALRRIKDIERTLDQKYKGSRSQVAGAINAIRQRIEQVMRDYSRTFPDETHDVDISIDAIDWYLNTLRRIQTDDLPQYTDRFKSLLDNKVRQSITTFRARLTQRETDIRKSIEQLNGALQRIAYTSSTYLRLVTKSTQNREIIDFQHMLANTYPNASADDQQAENARIFDVIRKMLARFETDRRWTQWVTDARNWLDFSAEERLISDNSLREYYQSSSGKSGGQKAKLAYTILASAIAYQYRLTDHSAGDDTFRFIVIDEVFSKSDEVNSRFAMDLFMQLGLQVLVVTPADKMQIVEPYINSCHLVLNNDQGTASKVRTLTVEQVQELRQQQVAS